MMETLQMPAAGLTCLSPIELMMPSQLWLNLQETQRCPCASQDSTGQMDWQDSLNWQIDKTALDKWTGKTLSTGIKVLDLSAPYKCQADPVNPNHFLAGVNTF